MGKDTVILTRTTEKESNHHAGRWMTIWDVYILGY